MENQIKTAHDVFPYRLSIAPMIGHTDKFYRMLMRLISKKVWLYSDMIHDHTLLQKQLKQGLEIDKRESPVILQIGSDNPHKAALASKRGEDLGYDEININAGCPSKILRKKKFGIYMMDDVENTVAMIYQIKKNISIPLSIKCRIGYDGTKYGMPLETRYEYLEEYVRSCIEAGVCRVSIHARIAIIGGINPELNRTIPPIKYDYVYRIAKCFVPFPIEINGNIINFEECVEHLDHVSAVMIGREAVQNPLMFYGADKIFFEGRSKEDILSLIQEYSLQEFLETKVFERAIEIVQEFKDYIMSEIPLARTSKYRLYVSQTIRHLLGFFDRYEGGAEWNQSIKESLANAEMPDVALDRAMKLLSR